VLQQSFLASRSDQLFHTLGFSDDDAAAGRGEAIVTAALVVFLRRRTIATFLNDPVGEQSLDDGVESAGAEPDVSIGLLLDIFQDGVAMLLAIAEGEQDLKHSGGQDDVGRLTGRAHLRILQGCLSG